MCVLVCLCGEFTQNPVEGIRGIPRVFPPSRLRSTPKEKLSESNSSRASALLSRCLVLQAAFAPDAMSMAKSIAAGFPMGAMCALRDTSVVLLHCDCCRSLTPDLLY